MKHNEKTLLTIYKYMVLENKTLEEAEKASGISHSTLHWYAHKKLKHENALLHSMVIVLFDHHKKVRKRKNK